jgi:hypothetical protein
MRNQIVLAVSAAAVMAAGITAPASAASVPRAGVTVSVHGVYFHHQAHYRARPKAMVLMEPGHAEVNDMQWSAWGATSRGTGELKQAGGCGCGVPARVVLSRVRAGHFTRMAVYSQTSPNTAMWYWWPGKTKASTVKVWQHHITGS